VSRSIRLRVALLALVAVLVYLGLTPFSFKPPNRVRWLPAGSGLMFEGRGLIHSAGALSWDGPPLKALSIHLLVEPGHDAGRGLGALLSIHDGGSPSPLLIAEWRNWLILRVRQPENEGGRGYWEIGAKDALSAFEQRMVTIVSDSEHGTRIFIDGELRQNSNRSIVRSGTGFGGRLVFGSLGDGSAGWSGTLRGLSLYEGSLGADEVAADVSRVVRQGFAALDRRPEELAFYSFGGPGRTLVADQSSQSRAGPLIIPSGFAPLARRVFEIPEIADLWKPWFFWDGLRNLLGFIPLGFLAVLVLIERRDRMPGRKAVGLAILLGSCLSLGIEAIQIFLPLRISSFIDLVVNIFGTGLGAMLALWMARVVPTMRGTRRPIVD